MAAMRTDGGPSQSPSRSCSSRASRPRPCRPGPRRETSVSRVAVDGVLAYRSTTADLGTDNIATIQIGNDTAKQTFRLDADDIEVRP